MLAEYRRRRDFMVEALNAMPGCRCRKPDGAFYIFVNIAGTGMDSDGFCRTMIDEAGVSMTPGHVFGTMGDGFVLRVLCQFHGKPATGRYPHA